MGESRVYGSGNDLVFGRDTSPLANPYDDYVDGGAGNDVIIGDGAALLGVGSYLGPSGADTLIGGDGDDVLIGFHNYVTDTAAADNRDDHLSGGAGDDTLVGGSFLDGGEGDDRIQGLGADDIIDGGPGDDLIFGGLGRDVIQGGIGADRILTTGVIRAGGNADVILNIVRRVSSTGTVTFESPPSPVSTTGANDPGGNVAHGGDGNDAISGVVGDSLYGDDGDDFLEVYGPVGGGGTALVDGGSGTDTIGGYFKNGNLLVDLEANIFPYANLVGIEAMSVTAEAGHNTLFGGGGADRITALGGNNVLDGRGGNDTLTSYGLDTLIGGDGNDTLSSNSATGPTLSRGGDGNDTVLGGLGADTVEGGAGNDSIRGGGGDDLITGGAGADQLFGQGGADTFAVLSVAESSVATGIDTIQDFETGIDRLDLHKLGVTPSDVTITSDGVTTALTANAPGGQLAISFKGANAIQLGDIDFIKAELTPSVIAENPAGRTRVGTLDVPGDNVAGISSTLGGPDAALFRLEGGQILVADGAKLDFEESPTRRVSVDVTLTNGTVVTLPFTIGVTDVEEAPTDLTLSRKVFTLDHQFFDGQSLGVFKAVDEDRGEVYGYTLQSGGLTLFQVVGDALVVANAAALNLLVEPAEFNISVRADSLDGERIDRPFNLRFVTDDKPIANADVFKYGKDTRVGPVTIDVLANDLSPAADFDLSSVLLTSQPGEGSAIVLPGGKIQYTPSASGFAKTSFTYTFEDAKDHKSNEGTIRIAPKGFVPDPFVVGGIELKDVENTGYAEATGDFTIGRSDGTAELLRVTGGNIRAYDDRLQITGGTVYSAIGGPAATTDPIFKGSFTLAVAGAKGAVIESEKLLNDLELATLPFDPKQIQLEPDAIQIGADFYLASVFGPTVTLPFATGLEIDSRGADFSGGVFRLPDLSVKAPILNWTASAKGVGLTYAPVDDSLKLQGTFELEDSFFKEFLSAKLSPVRASNREHTTTGVTSIKLDLGNFDDPKNLNYVQLKENATTGNLDLTGKGVLSFPEIKLGSGFVIKDLSGSLEVTDSRVALGGSLKYGIPFGPNLFDPVFFDAGFEVVVEPKLELNKINFGISNVNIPIPAIPLLSINKLAARAEGLASGAETSPNTNPLTIGGTIGLDYGLPTLIPKNKLPVWLGIDKVLAGFDINLELDGKLQVSRTTGDLAFGGSGTFFFVDPGLLKATIGTVAGPAGIDLPLVNFSSGGIDASASFNLGSVFSGSGKLTGDLSYAKSTSTTDLTGSANHPFVAASATGSFTAPFGPFKGKTFASADLYGSLSFRGDPQRDLAESSIGVTATVQIGPGPNGVAQSVPIGFQFYFNGELDLIDGGRSLPKVGSWDVGPGEPYLIMTATWENAAQTPPEVYVTFKERVGGPVLATYRESEFADHDIHLVEDLSGQFGRTVSVMNPTAGVWDIYVVDPTGLGEVTYDGLGRSPTPEVEFSTDVLGSTIVVRAEVSNTSETALIDVFSDSDASGFDGQIIQASLTPSQAAAGVSIDPGSLTLDAISPGTLHLYAKIRDKVTGVTTSGYTNLVLASWSLFDTPAEAGLVGSFESFAPALAAATAGNEIALLDPSGVKVALGVQDVSVEGLTVKAGSTLSAEFHLGTGVTTFALSGDTNASVVGNGAANTILGGAGANKLEGGEGADVLYGFGGDDVLLGGTASGTGTNYLLAGSGSDTASYAGTEQAVYADLRSQGGVVAGVLTDLMDSVENLTGGTAGDTLVGHDGANVIEGGLGSDQIYGFGGDDVLIGGAADPGTYNILFGGDGSDTASFSAATSDLYIDLRAPGAFLRAGADLILTDVMDSVENATGGSGNDLVVGNDSANRLAGGGGTDQIYGFGGDDVLLGGSAAAGGYNILIGGTGFDVASYADATSAVQADLSFSTGYVSQNGSLVLTDLFFDLEGLIGGTAADTLLGDESANQITGGRGADVLYGRGGSDRFVFTAAGDSSAPGGYDTIVDFASGSDKIDLSSLGLQASQSLILSDGATTTFYADTDTGTAGYEFAVSFIGANALLLTDVVF